VTPYCFPDAYQRFGRNIIFKQKEWPVTAIVLLYGKWGGSGRRLPRNVGTHQTARRRIPEILEDRKLYCICIYRTEFCRLPKWRLSNILSSARIYPSRINFTNTVVVDQKYLHQLTIFWVVTQSSVVQVYLRFGGTYCLHLQGWWVNCTFKQHALCCLSGPEGGGNTYLQKIGKLQPY
jgi:hypothetical protein